MKISINACYQYGTNIFMGLIELHPTCLRREQRYVGDNDSNSCTIWVLAFMCIFRLFRTPSPPLNFLDPPLSYPENAQTINRLINQSIN